MRVSIADGNYSIDIAERRQWHPLPPGADPIVGPIVFWVPGIFLSGEM
jgi:hypothetical protein